jgi:hypothetical protein
MSIFYLNHNIFESQKTVEELRNKLKETINIFHYLTKNNLRMHVYSNLWDITVLGETFRAYLYKLNRDEVNLLILSLINTGPFYYEEMEESQIVINPNIPVRNFAAKLLEICFKDKHDLILSINGEPDLYHRIYELIKDHNSYRVENYIGLDDVKVYIESNLIPQNISQVFKNISQYSTNILILDSAIKASRQHNFQGKFKEVLNVITALEEVELPLLKEGVNDEERKRIFYESTGFEISKESEKTLKVKKYRNEREFFISGIGQVLFEWHIKIGLSTRIHYYIDKENSKIYVGHCGRHLGTVSYNS